MVSLLEHCHQRAWIQCECINFAIQEKILSLVWRQANLISINEIRDNIAELHKGQSFPDTSI